MLQVEDLRTGYGKIDVVHGVSLDVPHGQVTAVIGANGAGKTALIQAICGLLPHRGTVRLDGNDVSHLPAHERARTGIMLVPEGRRVFAEMSVWDNLISASLHPRVRGDRKKVLEEVFSIFPRIKERLNQHAETLSGGEQQMVAIARALMGAPRVLLLDEPSLGLAPMAVRQVFDVVSKLRSMGRTVLLVEQNIHHCLEVSDFAYVLEHGRVILQGPAADVLVDARVRAAYLG